MRTIHQQHQLKDRRLPEGSCAALTTSERADGWIFPAVAAVFTLLCLSAGMHDRLEALLPRKGT